MSRSYKKNPVMKSESKAKRFWKKEANKKVRHTKDVPNGREFKKIGDTYNINDYVSKSYTKKDVKRFLKYHKPYQIFMK